MIKICTRSDTLDDYRQMFDLSDNDIQKDILIYPGGASPGIASLKALQGQQPGEHVLVAADPAYQFSVDEITAIYAETYSNAPDEAPADWELRLEQFLANYKKDEAHHRYIATDFPTLPFKDFQFQLALCPSLLATDMDSAADLVLMINELCRVSHEVRLFPIPNDEQKTHLKLGPLMLDLQQRNFGVELKALEGPFVGDAMMRIWPNECVVDQ